MKHIFFCIFCVLAFCSGIFAQNLPGSGNSLVFNGSNYITCSTNDRFITTKVTIQAWIKTTNFGLQVICSKFDNAADRGFQLYTQNGRASFSVRDGSGLLKNPGLSAQIVADGKWHHIAAVYYLYPVYTTHTDDHSNTQVFVDGIGNQGISHLLTVGVDLRNIAPLSIGNNQYENNNFFIGEIDEVRVWNKWLFYQDNWKNMCQKLKPGTPYLSGYFNLDEGSGTRSC